MFLVGPGVAQAQVLFLESFNRTGTLAGSSPDISPGSPQTWVNGNPDAVTLNGSQGIWNGDSQPRVEFAAGELLIPSQSSGLSLEVEVRVSAIDGVDMDRGEIRFQSGPNEFFVPGMGQVLSSACVNGEYCIGGWNGGAATQATGVATPASPNDSHVVRTLNQAYGLRGGVRFDAVCQWRRLYGSRHECPAILRNKRNWSGRRRLF